MMSKKNLDNGLMLLQKKKIGVIASKKLKMWEESSLMVTKKHEAVFFIYIYIYCPLSFF